LIDIKIGKKIRELRNRWGLSQSELAERIGISFQQVQKYEKGVSRMSIMRLQQFADALDVTVMSFLEAPDEDLQVREPVSEYAVDHASPDTAGPTSKEEIALLKLFRRVKNRKMRESILKQIRGIIELEKQK